MIGLLVAEHFINHKIEENLHHNLDISHRGGGLYEIYYFRPAITVAKNLTRIVFHVYELFCCRALVKIEIDGNLMLHN